VGEVLVPRGRWFEYKYARGDWDTVEKWSGCLEAGNRYALGAAHPGKSDRVDVWADACP
jgi:alpha-glucosidase